MPPIPHWKENNVRKGFLTIERDSRLADACASVGLWLRTMLEMGYTFGWRVSELKNLEGRQIDIGSSRILLDPGTTKNDDGRVVKFKPGSLLAVFWQPVVTESSRTIMSPREETGVGSEISASCGRRFVVQPV
jgi:integrase